MFLFAYLKASVSNLPTRCGLTHRALRRVLPQRVVARWATTCAVYLLFQFPSSLLQAF
jgi:hypothetical protein